ncbi:hypothetical protein BCR33DRAFT_716204, partial [Rhizoclosmatium globosum]
LLARSPEYDHFEVIAPCFIDPRAPSGLSLPSPVPAHSSYGVSYHGHDTRPIHCPQSQAETPATTDSRPPTLSTEEVDGMSIEELERYAALRHVRYRKVWEREQKEMLKVWRSENEVADDPR